MTEVAAWAALPAAILLVLAGLLAVTSALGLLRLPDFFARLHAPAMSNTLGIGCVLIASMLVASAVAARFALHELLITLFVVITAPITAMMLVRAALYRARMRGPQD